MIIGENILIHYLCQDETHISLTTSFLKYCDDWLKTEKFQLKDYIDKISAHQNLIKYFN